MSWFIAEAMSEGFKQAFHEVKLNLHFKGDKARIRRQARKIMKMASYDIDYEKEAVALASLVTKFFNDYKVCRQEEEA